MNIQKHNDLEFYYPTYRTISHTIDVQIFRWKLQILVVIQYYTFLGRRRIFNKLAASLSSSVYWKGPFLIIFMIEQF